MKALRFENWSERQQVLAVILAAGFIIFALWFFLLLPLNRRRARLETDIENMANTLARRNYLRPEEALSQEKGFEFDYNRKLHGEWRQMADRLAGFANQERLGLSNVGHIDFKVALFEVRRRLMAKSRALDISLPHDLGMDELVTSNEDARKLMLQLRAVEKLVNMALDLKIDTLRNIEPLPPIPHRALPGQDPYLEEYPVRADFQGSLDNLYDLFTAILEPEHVFMMKNLRVETSGRDEAPFDVSVVLSALLFLQQPDDVIPPPKEQRRRAPKGY